MPDVIPSYHFDPESIEMQNMGQGDDNDNATYETVGTRVSAGYDGNVIGKCHSTNLQCTSQQNLCF